MFPTIPSIELGLGVGNGVLRMNGRPVHELVADADRIAGLSPLANANDTYKGLARIFTVAAISKAVVGLVGNGLLLGTGLLLHANNADVAGNLAFAFSAVGELHNANRVARYSLAALRYARRIQK